MKDLTNESRSIAIWGTGLYALKAMHSLSSQKINFELFVQNNSSICSFCGKAV